MNKLFTVLIVCLVSGFSAKAQISLTLSGYTENFDIGTSTTASLPSGFKMSPAGASSPTWSNSGNFSAVSQGASSGSPSQGGRYNWGNGTSTSDRAIGFMTSGSYGSPNSIMADFTNNTGSTISSLELSYDYERYRINTAAASVSFYYSLDGSTWTLASAGNSGAFTTGSSSYTFSGGTVVSKSFTLTGLSIASGSDFYLRWSFETTGSNSQGIGLDNLSVSASAVPEPYHYGMALAAMLGIIVFLRCRKSSVFRDLSLGRDGSLK